MPFLDKILALFQPQPQDSTLEIYPESANIVESKLEGNSSYDSSEQTINSLQANNSDAIEWPSWLNNDDQLRDEGVLFGLTDSKPDEKIGIIKSYFGHQTAAIEREVEQHGERIQEINLFIEQRETRIAELKNKLVLLESQKTKDPHQLLRTVIGLTFSVAMCVGNYYLIADTLQPLYGHSQWIAMGVFLAGMFNLFGRISLFHDNSHTFSWRSLLEEVGMPLATSIFVFMQALQQQPLTRAIALFGFVFFLFLFAGKLLLSNLTVLQNEFRVWIGGMKSVSETKTKNEDWEAEKIKLETEIDEFRVQKWQILPNLNRVEAELARLNARRDMLIKSFESEFLLARQMRDRLSQRQLREINRRFEE